MRLIFQAILLLILVLTPRYIFASTLQVGSGQTYSTIGAAITAAVNGDSINVHAGTYSEILNVNKSVTIQANPGDSPIINAGGASSNVITINSNSVTITGFEIRNWVGSTNHGIFIYNQDKITVSNNIIHNEGAATTYTCVYVRNSTRITIQNNLLHHCGPGTGLVVQSSHSTDNTYANGTLIISNTIHDNPDDGIDIQGQYITIDGNNIFNNMDTNWVANHPDGIQLISSLVDGFQSVNYTIIRNNTIRNHNQNIYIAGTSATSMDTNYVYVYNNVIYDDANTLVNGVNTDTACAWGIQALYQGIEIHIYNNTLGRAPNSALGLRQGVTGGTHAKNNIIDNNFVAGGSNGFYTDTPAIFSAGELNYNLYFNVGNAVNWNGAYYSSALAFHTAQPNYEANAVDGNPKLNPFPYPGLQSSSPAKGVGVNLSTYFTIDKVGSARQLAPSPWDIGALVFKTTSPGSVTIK